MLSKSSIKFVLLCKVNYVLVCVYMSVCVCIFICVCEYHDTRQTVSSPMLPPLALMHR